MMVHIVQAVLSGRAEIPKLFIDEALAEAAYVDYANEYWAQSYPAFCEKSGISRDCYSSASAFIRSFDVVDKNTINYWSVKPEAPGFGNMDYRTGLELDKERLECFRRLTQDVEQASCAVKEGLTEITQRMEGLADALNNVDALFTSERHAVSPGGDSSAPLVSVTPGEHEEDNEKYTTPVWVNYVMSLKNACGGSWSEFRLFTRHDWRQAVYSNATSFEYWEWAAAKIDTCMRKAEKAGYTVIGDSERPGEYTFKTPDLVESEVFFSKEEAWCHAAQHADSLKR